MLVSYILYIVECLRLDIEFVKLITFGVLLVMGPSLKLCENLL